MWKNSFNGVMLHVYRNNNVIKPNKDNHYSDDTDCDNCGDEVLVPILEKYGEMIEGFHIESHEEFGGFE